MDDRIRLKQHVGKSVRDFTNQHPSEIEGHAATATQLSTVVDRMDQLFSLFETGQREVRAATREKDRLLDVIRREFLLPLAAIARGNSTLDPGLARRFRAPKPGGDQSAYLGAARAIRALGEEHNTLFIRDGMPASFVEDFEQALDAYDAAAAVANTNRQLHVQSRAELRVQSQGVMTLIRRLDGINRTRYRKDPHLYQAWLAARNVAWPVVNQTRLEGNKQQPAA